MIQNLEWNQVYTVMAVRCSRTPGVSTVSRAKTRDIQKDEQTTAVWSCCFLGRTGCRKLVKRSRAVADSEAERRLGVL